MKNPICFRLLIFLAFLPIQSNSQNLSYKEILEHLNSEVSLQDRISFLDTAVNVKAATDLDSLKMIEGPLDKIYTNSTGFSTEIRWRIIYKYMMLHKRLGNVEKAIDLGLLFEASIIGKEGFDDLRSSNNIMLGTVYNDLGQNTNALERYLKSLKYEESIGDSAYAFMAYINIAGVFLDLNDIEQSIVYYKRAENYIDAAESKSEKLGFFNNIGTYYLDIQDYKAAEQYLTSGLALIKGDIQFENEYYDLLENLGIVYSYTDRIKEAESNYRKVLSFGINNNNKKHQAMAHIDMSYLFSENDDLGKGIFHGKKALNLYESMQDTFGILTSQQLLYGLFEANKDYKLALNSYKDYEYIKQIMNSSANIKRITSLTKDYEFEKEKQEIAIDTAKKEERANLIQYGLLVGLGLTALFSFFLFRTLSKVRKTKMLVETQNTQLEELSASNEQLLFSLSHDIKEPMLGLQMLLDEIKLNDSILDDAKTSLNTQVKSVNSILRNLLDIKKNQGGGERFVDGPQIFAIIQEVLQSQVQKAESKQLNIELVQDKIEQLKFDLSPQKFYLLMLNTLNNAIKYSPKNGVVRVESQNGDLSISNTIRQEENLSAQSLQSDGVGLALVKELLSNSKVKLDIIKEVNLFKARLQTTA